MSKQTSIQEAVATITTARCLHLEEMRCIALRLRLFSN